MKKRLAGLMLVLAAFLGIVASGTSAAQIAGNGVNYGSGIYPGPTTSVIQDPGWASSSLKWGMVGDSITYRCAPELRAAFAAKGITLAVRANSGADMNAINNWLESLTYMPDHIIVAGGTNNIFDNLFEMPGQIVRTKAAIGLATELVWVDTYAGRSATLADDIRNSGQVNSYIHSAVPDDHVVDWLANLTSTRGRGLALSYYLQDGVHPWVSAGDGHGDGCANYAAVVMNTVTPLL